MNEQLWQAAHDNAADTCRELLNYWKHGDLCAQVNSKSGEDWTALHIAASEGNTDVCKVLLEFAEEVDVNAVNTKGSTPLHLAAEKGFLDIVQLLVNAGADKNAQDNEGNSPLHLVAMKSHVDTASWLLGKDPHVSLLNNGQLTAYQMAATPEVAELFELYFSERKITYTRSRTMPHESPSPTLEAPAQDQIDRMLLKAQDAHSPMALRLFIERAWNPVYDIVRTTRTRTPSPSHRHKSGSFGAPHPEYMDFIPKYLIGRGSFGEVYLVKKRGTEQVYAMKVLPKEKIITRNLMNYAITERNVLSYFTHPFIVGLNYAFQTPEKLVLILDYCPGGDLGKILEREERIEESRARIYICEVLLALEELHKRDIIYRDLKPDNVVLDATGHALLTDFGLSKEGMGDNIMTQSFCGSIAYLAPEVLIRKGHGKAVDWYLLGVLLYEMIVGDPPFFSSNPQEMFRNIKNAPLLIPTHVSPEAKDLLHRLLERNPKKRLGSAGESEIKNHPFFSGIDWAAVYRRELKPPLPRIRKLKEEELSQEDVFGILNSGRRSSHLSGWSFVHKGN